jgi:hypothetical protein
MPKLGYRRFATELLRPKLGMLRGKPAFASEPLHEQLASCPFSPELQRWYRPVATKDWIERSITDNRVSVVATDLLEAVTTDILETELTELVSLLRSVAATDLSEAVVTADILEAELGELVSLLRLEMPDRKVDTEFLSEGPT